jgi:hypothetical protein
MSTLAKQVNKLIEAISFQEAGGSDMHALCFVTVTRQPP